MQINTLCDQCHEEIAIKIDWLGMLAPSLYLAGGLVLGYLLGHNLLNC